MSAAAFSAPRLRQLTAIEMRKMVDTRAGFWLVVSSALVAVATVVVRVGWAPHAQTLEGLFTGSVEATSTLLPVLGILAVTAEWSHRTALSTFTLVPRRERVIAGKAFAGAALAATAVVLCLAVALAGSSLGETGADMSLSLGTVGRVALYQLVSVLGGIAFGLALRSSATAIVAYFVVPLVVSALTALIPSFTATARWLDVPTGSLSRLLDGAMDGAAWAQLATGTLIWIAVPVAVGLVRLRRSDAIA